MRTTSSTQRRAFCPRSGLGAALITATGLSYSSPVPTSQSSAFLSEPGMPPAYSGVAMTMASARVTAARSEATGGPPSSSGLKWGSAPSSSQTSTWSGAAAASARTRAELADDCLRLPEMATRCTGR